MIDIKIWFMHESVDNPDSKIANKLDVLQGIDKSKYNGIM